MHNVDTEYRENTETEYRELIRISPYSVRMLENADQNNSKYGHFLRRETCGERDVFYQTISMKKKTVLACLKTCVN